MYTKKRFYPSFWPQICILPPGRAGNRCDDDGQQQQDQAHQAKQYQATQVAAHPQPEHLPEGEQEEGNHHQILSQRHGAHVGGRDEGQTQDADYQILTPHEGHGCRGLGHIHRRLAVAALPAEDQPEGQRQDGHQQEVEEAEVVVDVGQCIQGHLLGEVALHGADPHRLGEFGGELAADVAGGLYDVRAHHILVGQDEEGGQQQDGAEGVGIVAALAGQVVGHQVARTVEQVDERARQVGLQSHDLRQEVVQGAAQGDALHRCALSALRAVDSLKLRPTIAAYLPSLARRLGLGNHSPAYHLLDVHTLFLLAVIFRFWVQRYTIPSASLPLWMGFWVCGLSFCRLNFRVCDNWLQRKWGVNDSFTVFSSITSVANRDGGFHPCDSKCFFGDEKQNCYLLHLLLLSR